MQSLLKGFFKKTRKPIVYNVVKTPSGWQIQAILPPRLSPSDKIKIIDWFHTYRSTIRAEHPGWSTTFHASESVYLLTVIPTIDQSAVIAAAVEAAQTWKQLDLDYA